MTKPGTKAPSKRRPPGDQRRLSEVARHVIAPTDIVSTSWPRVRDTCKRLGWDFDGWQDGAGRLILAKRSDGSYAADTIVISIPRQVGKTYLIGCIIFALCLLSPGLTVIWTAHRKTTAAETFSQFDGMAQRPKVAPHVRQVLRGKGDEKILFTNGSRILFGARESGFGRGMADIDVLVFDEGQILKDDTLEDMGAAQNVAKNPLTFIMGTPPRPKDPGEFFGLMRQEALDGESDGTLYIELSADRGCDPMDRDQWRKANPSFPHRTSERAMLRLRKKLKIDDSWNREALGIWDKNRSVSVLPKGLWARLADTGTTDDAKPDALSVDMSHDRRISISACWLVDECAHVEEVWSGRDEAAGLRWMLAATEKHRRMPIVIDVYSPAKHWITELTQQKRNPVPNDMAKACGLFVSWAGAMKLTHGDQKSVNDALEGARKRPIGTAGGWGWDRKDETSYIAPIVSVSEALYGAVTHGRRGNGRSTGGRRGYVS